MMIKKMVIMTEKEYIESFGWKPEDLSASELKEVRKELCEIEKGNVILDSVLFHKPFISVLP